MKYLFWISISGLTLIVAATGIFLFRFPHETDFKGNGFTSSVLAGTPAIPSGASAPSPSSTIAATTTASSPGRTFSSGDIGPQPQLADPPSVVKGAYATAWIAGSSRMQDLIDIIDKTELNAVVIDIKDYSGYVSYTIDDPLIRASGAEKDLRIAHPNTLIKELHDHHIYVIGRVTVFQDPILAVAHPEWALKNKNTGGLWSDKSGLHWMDADSKGVWDYVGAISRDAYARGFDEINFDYMRFPSDGDLSAIGYPFYNGTTPKHDIIEGFWNYERNLFPGKKLSGDIFGLTTVAADDLGIGQKINDAYGNFDAIAPMVYPSHYANGFQGFKNPADHPYEVIQYSMAGALARYKALLASSTDPTGTPPTLLRPWLQVFDLGAVYTPAMVAQEIKAVDDTLKSSGFYGGWLLWDPNVRYTSYKNIPS